ncbi:glutathione S-transferase family protein [Alloalcanivorax xenomutans]|jgi:glutathione S-transferase|uniref:Glutathione S-transferase family protein n=1 Tax=Alloalcanivorax xenomutans TaxID=1094342 RepID=A0A9Q3ZE71_9GAMM|nr:glutathione S-transferase family protein [Alloalcanivorax xenomutans]ERS15008.1 glutathione S-transferase [Alcanivorax sp. PN-3]KYZ87093.1 glutathione S-transferase [Alcanivorax sp. KX64203]PHS57117.1 MAG: glutathione S-transferase family protein [Alcanivorax sp.]ARB45276.1 glutathione S-transferase [Alloalcanivorax xenomutans]MCE7510508.1 glutathione S-transferase family protein [Alloalcanivorax xenomutans]
MTIKLYGAMLSPFVRKTRVVLALKGVEHETVNVDPRNAPDWYRDLNPLGRIPALDYDGQILADSGVICAFLEKKHPEPSLYPEDPYEYARTLWFEKFGDYELGVNCTFGVFFNRVVRRLMGKEVDEAAAQKALQGAVPPLLEYLDRELEGKTYFVGERLTVADIAVASQLVNFQHAGEGVDQYPNLAAHKERLHALEPFTQTIAKESGFLTKVLGG